MEGRIIGVNRYLHSDLLLLGFLVSSIWMFQSWTGEPDLCPSNYHRKETPKEKKESRRHYGFNTTLIPAQPRSGSLVLIAICCQYSTDSRISDERKVGRKHDSRRGGDKKAVAVGGMVTSTRRKWKREREKVRASSFIEKKSLTRPCFLSLTTSTSSSSGGIEYMKRKNLEKRRKIQTWKEHRRRA